MKDFIQLVAEELTTARRLHMHPINSLHEGYAVIAEELDEFWEQVRCKPGHRSKPAMLDELVQIAAMCQRAAEDLALVQKPAPGAVEELRLSADGWLATPAYSDILIVDPAGWNRRAVNWAEEWATPLTRAEFEARLVVSSVGPRRPARREVAV